MQPALSAGDYVIACRWPGMRLTPSNIVVVKHPDYPILIKRIAQINQQKHFWLSSDNPNGLSSEQIGECQPAQLIGKVVWHVKRPLEP